LLPVFASASSGGSALIDVSGPGSQISDQPSDSYKYCVVDAVPGECRPGSKVGDIYINAPGVTHLTCSGGDGPNPGNKDLCLGNFNPYYQAMEQLYLSQLGTADATAHSRVITAASSTAPAVAATAGSRIVPRVRSRPPP